MQRQTTIATLCERLIEGGWLLAVLLIPSYFNLLSSRHFEPDKATALRAIVLVMIAAAAIRWIERLTNEGAPPPQAERQGALARLRGFPLAIPLIVYAGVFLLSTATSIVPDVSFWGSYQRLQGTYTNLSYMALAALIGLHLRTRAQLQRLVFAVILGSLPAIGYGLIQHAQLDPLPWRGDVISRVASTMGNSIFVAAYLIMVLPLALAWVVWSLHAGQQRDTPAGGGADFGWALAYGLLGLAGMLQIYAALIFGAVVRSADLDFWWVFPGAVIAAGALFLTPTFKPHAAERITFGAVAPGALMVGFALWLVTNFAISQPRVVPPTGHGANEWLLWSGASLLLTIVGYILIFLLPRRSGSPSRVWLRLQAAAMLVIAGLLVTTIFFTQSRGPWIGAGAGLAVFFTLLLLQARRRALLAPEPEQRQRATLWRNLLLLELALAVGLGGFLLAFNLSKAPFFENLRKAPYIGRMGTLLETDDGTGLVRKLIWVGDDKAGGAVALITSNPLRTIIGYGPETMFVAYNKFYPPSLANIESRGASPDRSHQAYLDELVTKGALGLASYLFVIVSFFALAWRILRNSADWSIQVLVIGAVAVVVSHLVEGLTGIPIVATLMLLWVTLAVTVLAGAQAGVYRLDGALPAPEPVPEPIVSAGQPAKKQQQRQRGAAARGAQGRTVGAAQGRSVGVARANQSSPAAWGVAAIVLALALAGAWFLNADNVYADMRFQQGQIYSENPQADLTQQLAGMTYFIDAIRIEPSQDFYYLNLGRTLMSVVDIRRQNPQIALGATRPNAKVEDLFVGDVSGAISALASSKPFDTLPGTIKAPQTAPEYVLNLTPLETMSYAQVVLERARQLSPGNKDHYANLGRMHSFWYSRLTRDPDQLTQAVEWYRQASAIAPQDVTILNEYASTVALAGSVAQTKGDSTAAQAAFDQANTLLQQSRQTDPRYTDTDVRLADVQRLRGDLESATDGYVAAIGRSPHAIDQQISAVIDALRGQPALLTKLGAAYDAAIAKNPKDTALLSYAGLIAVRSGDLTKARERFGALVQQQPSSIEALRNYTLVLSDSKQYREAATTAEQLLKVAQQQQPGSQLGELQALISFFKQQAGG